MGVEGITVSANAASSAANGGWLRALELTKSIVNHPNRILPTIIEEVVERSPDAPALLSTGECLSYRALVERANRYARWARRQHLGKGDVVCLLMPNRPEYMAVWLGITRLGGVVALLNTNLAGASLAHCIDIAHPKHIIMAQELLEAFRSAQGELTTNPRIWVHGKDAGEFANIGSVLETLSGEKIASREQRASDVSDQALLIYTSGTTGLPKAANVSHYRLLTWSLWFAGMMNTQPSDRMYNCLPMYHSIGGVVATGAMLVNGGSVVIRDRFSAGEFWDDVVQWDCTLFQYIGELCRYLLLASPHPRERAHRIRLACGNGLRADVWTRFKDRFQLPQILEFYAATEGNVTLFNCEGQPGAIGRVPPFLAHRSPTALVGYDVETGGVVRNELGHCVRCRPGETGEAIGKIARSASEAGGRFEGYTNSQDTEKKILRNVFKPGDAWFRTGDLMRKDDRGFFYFIDRVGDTFRWKGENVSATEVEQAITAFPEVAEASVYGVEIPGVEGRAGMAAVVVEAQFELAAFRDHLLARLPAYACPVFLRLVREIGKTTTFKHKKGDLVREGCNPDAFGEAIYFNDQSQNAFVQLDQELYDRIRTGQIRL
jgi:fatty-acyl-CoA synthase